MTQLIDSKVNVQTTFAGQDEVPFFQVVGDRRSVRKYDSSVKISEDELHEILTIATKAPSSANMQPWRFMVVTDEELKQKLVPIAFNQSQVAEASAVIIVMADLEMYTRAEEIYAGAVEAGFMTEEVKTNMVANYSKMYASMPADRLRELVAFDTGLVAMQLMLTARAKGYDTVPMGGYNRDQAKELLGISDRYLPTLMLPIGKAAAQGHPTTRLPIDRIVSYNGKME
ncbi:nitroreductase family protein [Paenibacillus sp. LHD-117]|uniref:nitroreductase family protein n=1 Tax=Paenibacillus sp. LHD-117 TaxID=3071412 RepID=UPI0027DF0A4B|nr:nitroreductase family protein [Paenibacillus sp. LHD-117]MDQ6421151.1 nitroreductase family protein [Paenibacillus sp. LHD-117]